MAEEPAWQTQGVYIWTGRSNFDPVREMLREKHGLVDAKNSPLIKDMTIIWPKGRKLVYADPHTRQGIYRVDFREKERDYWPNDLISFRYWHLDDKLQHIREEDPMKSALVDTCRLIHPDHVTIGIEIGDLVDLEELLGIK